MDWISPLNSDHLLLSETLSEGHQGAAVPRDPAFEAARPGSSRNVFPESVSSPTPAYRPPTETQEGEWPGPDLKDRPAFRVTISPAASRLARGIGRGGNPVKSGRPEGAAPTGDPDGKREVSADGNRAGRVHSEGERSSRGRDLNDADQRDVEELQRQDRRVRQHEQAHMAAGGRTVRGGARYEYTAGPDGRRYATGGEVPVDLSAEKDPRATLQKMNTVRRAALAPADPSAADRAVAASASRKAAEARRQLSENQNPKSLGDSGEPGGVGRTENPVQRVQAGPSSSRAENRVDSAGLSGEATASVPESSANAVLRTGLLRALSRVAAPPPQSSSQIDRYA